MDEWGVDICVAGPHKCLGAAPGSALMAVSDRAWEAMRSHPTPLRKGYLSLLDWKELWMEQRRFPFTIFVAQINGVNEALTMVLEEGLYCNIESNTSFFSRFTYRFFLPCTSCCKPFTHP